MRYMNLVKSAEGSRPPPQALMDAIAKLGMEAAQAGVMVEMGGLLPSAMATRIRTVGGRLQITDGPFTEAKEVIGGYAVYDLKTKEEAIEWGRRFMQLHLDHWPEWEGECEIRPLFEAPPPGMQGG